MQIKTNSVRTSLGIAGIYWALVVVTSIWTVQAQSPFLFGDEYLYKTIAQSLTSGQGYTVEGAFHSLYPPLYPLFLTPAFLAGDDWYRWMLHINAIASSTIVIPVWLIAKRIINARAAWVCACIVGLMPYLFTYPRMLLSENLAVPIFLWACYLMLLNSEKGLWRHVILGVVLGLMWLTKYILGVIVPFFVILWWLQPLILGKITVRQLVDPQRIKSICMVIFSTAITFGPWPIIIAGQGGDIRRAFGYYTAISQTPSLEHVDLSPSLWPWVVFHIAALCLLCAPYLFAATISYLNSCNANNNTMRGMPTYFSILVWGPTLILGATATVFFWRLFGPNWQDGYISERYYIYAIPLFPVFAMLALRGFEATDVTTRYKLALGALLPSVLLIAAAYMATAARIQTPRPPLYVTSQAIYAAAFYLDSPMPGTFLYICCATLLVQAVSVVAKPRATMMITTICLMAIYVINTYKVAGDLNSDQSTLIHARQVVELINNDANLDTDGPIHVVFSNSIPITNDSATFAYKFWGAPDWLIYANKSLSEAAEDVLYVTDEDLENALVSYWVLEKEFYIYRLPPPVAKQLYPEGTPAGVVFNVQSSGDAAIGIMGEYISSQTKIVWGSEVLNSLVANSNYITAIVPSSLFAVPGQYQITLNDGIRESNPLIFTVD
jgi:4-amino-4-deoxy-L-arabinose transferase-like glycosyltransferase